jgi:S-adenosyl methyltransferase
MFIGVLGHVADYDEVRSIVARVMAAVPSGSYLVLWDGIETSEAVNEALEGYKQTGAVPYIVRSLEQIGGLFEGLETVEPGLVSISQWQPDPADGDTAQAVDGYGAVARKP